MSWLPFFVAITALAFVAQAIAVVALYLQFRRTSAKVERIAGNVEARVLPILTRAQIMMEDAQPRITSVLADAAEFTYLARNQAQKVDRVFTETLDRLRLQLAHVDQILTGALETVEDAGKTVRRSVLGPVQSATAVLRGIQTGIEFLRSRRRHRHDGASHATGDLPDENLFI
ncbi:MAG: hypothetical protein WA871_06195 [Candidatus Acidiferrales bacterium]